MWFLHAMDPHGAPYTIANAYRIRGPLDIPALAGALEHLVARHEMLRAGFPVVDGRVVLVTRPTVDFALRFCRLDAADDAWIKTVTQRPFDLAAPPLMRAELARAGVDDHVLAIAFHHIIADGWSLGVFSRELGAVYRQLRRGERPSLPPLAASAVAVQRELHQELFGPRRARALERWLERLAGLPVLELPFARPRPPVARFAGRRAEHVVDALPVERLARECNASAYMVLLAALAVLLHRYSNQRDLVVGSPVANRTDPRAEGLLGLFVNTVVMRVTLEDGDTMRDVVQRVRRVTLEALDGQVVPFEWLVERLAPARALSHNPLFQVMFAYQNVPHEPLTLHGAEVTALAANDATVRFDLEWTVLPRAGRLVVRLVYNTDILEELVAQQLLANYCRLLDELCAAPERLIRAAQLVVGGERSGIEAAERAPAVARSSETLGGLLADVVARVPESVAVVAGREQLTFRELQRRAGRVGARLRAEGIAPGDVVGICVPRTTDLVSATLGVLSTGAAFVPLDPHDPEERRAFIVRDSGAKRVLVSAPTAFEGAECIDVVAALRCEHELALTSGARPEDVAYLIYTSGTTGRPKGVVVEHRNVVNTLAACQALYGTDSTARGLVLASNAFDVFYYELFAPLLAGGRSHLLTREELFTPSVLANALDEATCFQAVPGLMEHVLASLREQGLTTCPGMRHVITGGDLVPPALPARMLELFPRARITITYGPTESAIFCTSYDVPRDVPVAGHPIGKAIPGASVRIGDADGAPLPVGVAGEIWIGGAGVARGYLGRADETAARFRWVDGERLYRSGDRGRRAANGTLEFLGRADHQVKVRGFRIELGEVESVLSTIPGVTRAVAIVRGNSSSDRRLVAYVTLDERMVDAAADEVAARTAVFRWRELFDDAYGTRVRLLSGDRDFTGWRSSYTGQPFGLPEMEEWLARAIERIRSYAPREVLEAHSLRILDLGCGTGLCAFELARDCSRYVAVDFSARSVADLRAALGRAGLAHVEVLEREVDRIADLPDDFDVVLLNSVVQYLPDERTLRRVLEAGLARLRPGGVLFVGDVRSLPLLELFHVTVAASRSSGPPASVLSAAQRRVADDPELVVDPRYFTRFARAHESVRWVAIEPRGGAHANELARYRYDVALCRGVPGPPVARRPPAEWALGGWSLDRVRRTLEDERPPHLVLSSIPNVLLTPAVEEYAALARSASSAVPAVPRGAPVALDDLAAIAKAAGYRMRASCARGTRDGTFDVLLSRDGVDGDLGWLPADDSAMPAQLTNAPLRRSVVRRMTADIQRTLSSRLPQYMVPSAVIAVNTMPLTRTDKVDRDALPGEPSATVEGRSPESATELAVAEVWREILGAEDLAAGADFFDEGGTSLLAIQVVVALRARGLVLGPMQIFELRTIEGIAAWLDDRQARVSPAPAEPARPLGLRPAREIPILRPAPSRWPNATVLLTGATGMLGVHLLDALLEARARVVCLVRAPSDEAANARVRDQLAWYFAGARRDGFIAVAGDVRARGLGLGDEGRRHALRCDHVIHAAADVRHVAERSEQRATNLGGTVEVLALAAMSGARVHHISTIGVKGVVDNSVETPALAECDLDIGQRMTEPYSESKLAAERAVRSFFAESGRGTIHRIGTVAPDSSTGRSQRNVDEHFFMRYLRAIIELGLAPERDERRFSLLPADVLARAILAVADRVEADRHTFHWQNPHALEDAELVEMLGACGYAIDRVPPQELEERAAQLPASASRDAALGRLLPQLQTRGDRPVTLDTRWTDGWLDQLGITFPRPTVAWFERILSDGIALGYLRTRP